MTIGSVMMMISFSGILIPEGSIRKFASLAMGFMLITAIMSPFGRDGKFFEFKPDSFGVSEESIKEAESLYEKNVLDRHRQNLEGMIKEKIKHGSDVKAEVNEKGELCKVTLFLKGDESTAVLYIVDTLKLPRERIKLVYEND